MLVFTTPVWAILGVVFSAVAMPRKYTRRGVAIAGLVVGIVAVVALLVLVVAGLTSL